MFAFITMVCLFFTVRLIQLEYQSYHRIDKMEGMTFAMAISMANGLLIGEITAQYFSKGLFDAAMTTAVIAGFFLGFVSGVPFGIAALLDGILSGTMGGMMGAMLGNMLKGDGNVVLFFLLFLEGLVLLLSFRLIKGKVRVRRLRTPGKTFVVKY